MDRKKKRVEGESKRKKIKEEEGKKGKKTNGGREQISLEKDEGWRG